MYIVRLKKKQSKLCSYAGLFESENFELPYSQILFKKCPVKKWLMKFFIKLLLLYGCSENVLLLIEKSMSTQ